MGESNQQVSKDLLQITPVPENSSLLINKNIHKLEDLRKNFKAAPSSVLGQVRNFLPKLATANQELEERMKADPNFTPDIEQLDDEEDQHIEMDLALVEQAFSEDSSSDSESSEDGSEDSDKDIRIGPVTVHNIRLPNQPVKVGRTLVETLETSGNNVATNETQDADIGSDSSVDTHETEYASI
ncbi:NOP protein chaperone 1-like [Mya arenaria]|uniref:NOP protein chaperone 1-like n=1 Tax=Mya arenaria TaxID=6604 RepID=UPI0022E89968|nr:NOP protein chaperone 1-like [Mya arenaria]